MLKKYNPIPPALVFVADLFLVALCWVLAYGLRFYLPIVPVTKGIPTLGDYLYLLPFVVLVHAMGFRSSSVYYPLSGRLDRGESVHLLKSSFFSVLALTGITFFWRDYSYSRVVMVQFWGLSVVSLWLFRLGLRKTFRVLRERGYHLKRVLIVGTGELAQTLAQRIASYPELGLEIAGFLADEPEWPGQNGFSADGSNPPKSPFFKGGLPASPLDKDRLSASSVEEEEEQELSFSNKETRKPGGRNSWLPGFLIKFIVNRLSVPSLKKHGFSSVPPPYGASSVPPLYGASPVPPLYERGVRGDWVLGGLNDLQKVVREGRIDQLYLAFRLQDQHRLEEVMEALGEEMVDIKVVPDFLRFMRLNAGIEELDGLPIINLSEGPLVGGRRLLKRSMDVAFALAALMFVLPLMLLIALLVKCTSRGPVFYRQERMGLDGKLFDMVKFRSMRIDAENETGAVWARKNDDRCTVLGAFLRSTSLDELPQLFNVLRGDMSLVGPRPERPVFVQQFKKTIPQYMLRHKMKAGITGWAQVNGWRGNTSLEKRIQHDIYYIENWSLLFDLRILWRTLWKGLVNKNAY